MNRLLLIFAIIFFISLPAAKAQVKDTVIVLTRDSVTAAKDSITLAKKNKKKIYSTARRAAILSAVCPGLGQAYNKKYWKLPVIYAGLGGFGYMFVTNNKQYNYFRKNLIAVYDNNPNTVNQTVYSGEDLKIYKDDYKKSRNFGVIGFVAIYLVNIIDANVDGHLKTFDVSDDLSLSIDPWQQQMFRDKGYKTAMGLSLKINFK